MSEYGSLVEYRYWDTKVGGSNLLAAPIFIHATRNIVGKYTLIYGNVYICEDS
jgi:hypothetical protein